MKTKNEIEFTRVNNDVNGNPRYAFHFLALTNEGDTIRANANNSDIFGISYKYNLALAKAKSFGGRKFHNKQFGGGIVFSSYNTSHESKLIAQLKKVNTKFKKEWDKKDFKRVEKVILNHFVTHTYKFLKEHGSPLIKFSPFDYTSIDTILGLAYTSSSSFAGLFVCNAGYLMANETHHFTGFMINELNQVVAEVQDENEKSIYIQLTY